MKITSAKISAMPVGIFDPMPKVTVTLEDGRNMELFEFYPDEIQFTPADFIGLTVNEAWELKRTKDVAYLQS